MSSAVCCSSEHPNVEPRPTVANLATVAVLPVSDKVPLSSFTLELQHALNGIGNLQNMDLFCVYLCAYRFVGIEARKTKTIYNRRE